MYIFYYLNLIRLYIVIYRIFYYTIYKYMFHTIYIIYIYILKGKEVVLVLRTGKFNMIGICIYTIYTIYNIYSIYSIYLLIVLRIKYSLYIVIYNAYIYILIDFMMQSLVIYLLKNSKNFVITIQVS